MVFLPPRALILVELLTTLLILPGRWTAVAGARATAPDQTCVASDDGLSLCFDGPRVGSSAVAGRALGSRDQGQDGAGFALTVHSNSAEPTLVAANNLLVNPNFTDANASTAELPNGWAPYGAGLYYRTTDPKLIRTGGPGAAVVVNNTNGSGAGFHQTWVPSTPAEAETARLLLGGWSKLLSGGADGGGEDYSVYADIAYTDGTFLFGQHAAFDIEPGRGWQYAYVSIDLGGKAVKNIDVLGLFRGHVGVALFSEFYIGVAPAHAAPLQFRNGTSTATPHAGDCNSSVSVTASLAPSGWAERLALSAVFSGHSTHIRCDGAVALVPADGQSISSIADRAVSVSFSLPIDASGWSVFADADNFALVPNDSNGSEQIYPGGGLHQFGKLPNPVSRDPFFVVADSAAAVMAAVPMEKTVWAYRIVYNAGTHSIDIAFDCALTAASERFPAMSTFSFWLAWKSTPREPYRATLHRFYELHPEIYGAEHRLRDQGAWMPFIDDLAAIPNVSDFGIKYQEGGGSVNNSKWMNQHSVDILPYIEPGLMHWSLPQGMEANYSNLNATITECCQHPDKYSSSKAVICRQIMADAMVDETGHWIFEPENQAWNSGAVFFANLELDTLGGLAASRAAEEFGAVREAYRTSIANGYTIQGQYIDSSTAGFELLNYDPRALRKTRHPPLFDVSGTPVVLGAQPLFSFLKMLSEELHERGMTLMGNGLWTQPMQLPSAFDIAGTETNWQAPSTAVFTPPTPSALAFNRAMTGSGPYLYLMDTDFNTWGKDKTEGYFEVCLAYGFWPSFFSANAATSVYFKNASLYERDRPIFRHYVPLLRDLNAVGWQPLRAAALRPSVGTERRQGNTKSAFVERFGSVAQGRLFWTVRNNAMQPQHALTIELDLQTLGLPTGSYSVMELTKRVQWPAQASTVSVRQGARTASVQLPTLPPMVTLVIQIEVS